MSPGKIPTTSTDDCDILYENITSTNYCRTKDTAENCEEIGSTAMKCPYQLVQHHHCTCKLAGPEYPNYAAGELALFLKLQSGLMQYPGNIKMQVPSEETVELGTRILGDDNPVKYSDPEKDSNSTDCVIVWANGMNAPDPGADRPAEKSDDTKNSEAHQHKTESKNSGSSNNNMEESKYDLMPLSIRLQEMSTYSKQSNGRANSVMKKKKLPCCNCEICQISYASVDDLKLHLLHHVNDTEGNADIYNKSIIALQELNYLGETDKSRRQHVCTKCKKVFLNQQSLRYHVNISHADSRPWQCKFCVKNYTRKYHLWRHQFTHFNRK